MTDTNDGPTTVLLLGGQSDRPSTLNEQSTRWKTSFKSAWAILGREEMTDAEREELFSHHQRFCEVPHRLTNGVQCSIDMFSYAEKRISPQGRRELGRNNFAMYILMCAYARIMVVPGNEQMSAILSMRYLEHLAEVHISDDPEHPTRKILRRALLASQNPFVHDRELTEIEQLFLCALVAPYATTKPSEYDQFVQLQKGEQLFAEIPLEKYNEERIRYLRDAIKAMRNPQNRHPLFVEHEPIIANMERELRKLLDL